MWKRMTTWFKKQPVAIRATIIGGIFVIGGAVISISPYIIEKLFPSKQIAKLKIDRIVQDIDTYISKIPQEQERKREELAQRFGGYDFLSGQHMKQQVERVNEAITQLDNQFREAKRKIENELTKFGNKKFKEYNWLAEEYNKWIMILHKAKNTATELIQYNEKTFGSFIKDIVQRRPYKEFPISKYM